MAQLPYVEIHAPNVRFREGQLDRFLGHSGIAEVLPLEPAEDGSFGRIRIVFASVDVMHRYVEAGLAALGNRFN